MGNDASPEDDGSDTIDGGPGNDERHGEMEYTN
jgi:hypothetical protein